MFSCHAGKCHPIIRVKSEPWGSSPRFQDPSTTDEQVCTQIWFVSVQVSHLRQAEGDTVGGSRAGLVQLGYTITVIFIFIFEKQKVKEKGVLRDCEIIIHFILLWSIGNTRQPMRRQPYCNFWTHF
ncbi:hypothetical protein PVK06_028090 [Gossypium arboreum]|uniref:Uncharacterized protein n=1 Tax=Gossypium arboreum TaxID=29729 RepID=A0ABR0P211_GOSAR|nr:hypothetical protein PVK06_028090 [Gossypium arboreum]